MPDRVPPQPFERVEGAALTAEDVHDEVEVIEQDPFGPFDAFHQRRTFVQFLLERLFDRIRDSWICRGFCPLQITK